MKSYLPLIIVALVIAAVLGNQYYKKHEAETRAAAKAAAIRKMPKLEILFVGNSYTFTNDLPHMIANVAASDPAHPVNIEVGMFTHGNYSLRKLWAMKGREKMLHLRPWNIVVIQETSMETLVPEWQQDMQQYMIQWNQAISDLGAHTIVYETWARKPGSYWYTTHPEHDLFVSPAYMQQQVDTITNMLAKYIRAPVVPVGDYFAYCRDLPGAPQLYRNDGTHPSLAGGYLTALLFNRIITHNRPEDVTYVPPGLPPATAKFIVKCASYGEK